MLSVLLLSSSAMAWNHTGWLWSRDELPLQWWMSDYIEDSLSEDYQYDMLQQSFDNWSIEAPCAQLSNSFEGVREGHHSQGRDSGDRLNTIYFDDPTEVNGGGALAVTYTVNTGELAFSRNGVSYRYAYDSDIVFSQNVAWGETEAIDDGNCSGEFAVEGTATHEIGHLWGMAHSCEEDDVNSGNCDGDELYDAVMFWTGGPCEAGDAELNEDDVEGITALYGPYAEFAPTTETRGGVPLEVCFDLSSNSAITDAEWKYGDGESEVSTETEICHTYSEQGQYTINVTIRGNSDDCGEWEYTERERALVVVCEPPQPSEGFDGMFTYEILSEENDPEADTVMVQMINQADTTVYGCIEQAQWDVFKGDELIQSKQAWSPKLVLPADGTYRVVLNLGGPGGIGAEELSIETGSATGCSALGAGAALSGALIGLFAVGFRRRED
jgi:hypothetical protein